MTTFKVFFALFNNKVVVPTLVAMQKMVQFFHQKEIDMLQLGCTLPNLANICLNISINEKFCTFCKSDKDLCEKIREVITGGPSIVFKQKAVVVKTFIRNSSNICKAIVEIHAIQLCPYSMCQDMPTGLYTRWEMIPICKISRLDITDLAILRTWPCVFTKKQDENAEFRASTLLEFFLKNDFFRVDGYCNHCKTVFQAMECYYHFCPC